LEPSLGSFQLALTVTLQALLNNAERRQRFYYYDTVSASGVGLKDRRHRFDSPHEHRRILATLLKHSNFFVANRSRVHKPEFTAGRDKISARFSGEAAGTIMIGGAPRTEEAKRQFDWPTRLSMCRMIHLILAASTDLNGTPERLQRLGEIMFGGLNKDTSGCIEFG
jgi:hypothetical protein